jgi:DNA topoisomerase-3
MGRLFNANIKLTDEFEMRFDFGNESEENTKDVDFTGQAPLGKCPKCGNSVFEHGMHYICEKSVGTMRSCDFRTGKIILDRAIEKEQVVKLLQSGKTDLLTKFISKKKRPFSAYLAIDENGKIGFEFEQKKTKSADKKTKTQKNKKVTSKTP